MNLARLVHASWPKAHIVITSGQSDLTGCFSSHDRFVRKPYDVGRITWAIGDLCERAQRPASGRF